MIFRGINKLKKMYKNSISTTASLLIYYYYYKLGRESYIKIKLNFLTWMYPNLRILEVDYLKLGIGTPSFFLFFVFK